MKVVTAQKLDGIEDYEIVEQAVPIADKGQVLIKVAACGMGFVDALVATGRYQVKPQLPYTPGLEISGVVAAVGPGVSELSPGDRVMANALGGGLAEYVCVPAMGVTRLPGRMGLFQAAGFGINYLTALHALVDRAAFQKGERLLVLGAAGGVGTAAVQIGRILGGEIVAVASTEAKRDFTRANGAGSAIGSDLGDLRARVKDAFGGAPDVVFDPVGGELFESAFRSLAWRGRHLVIGFASGAIPKLPINLSLLKGAALLGVDVRQFLLFEAERARQHMETLLEWVEDGKLVPTVGREFPLSDFAEAMRFALSGAGTGKTIIHLEAEV